MPLFNWILVRLSPTTGKWIMRVLGGAALLFMALHMIPRYIDEYSASHGVSGTIDIHHCTGHQVRFIQRWSCDGSFHAADGTCIANVTLDVIQDAAPIDGYPVMVSSAHASHAYPPGPASVDRLLEIGVLAAFGGLRLYWGFGGKRWRGRILETPSANRRR